MTNVDLFEAKSRLSALAKRVAAGEEFVVTDCGRPVMKLAPVEDAHGADPDRLTHELEALRQEGAVWRKAHGQAPVTIEEIIAFVNEGRC